VEKSKFNELRHLNNPKNANFTKTPDKNIEKLVDASTCAFGNQS